jgi:hypothetical protein
LAIKLKIPFISAASKIKSSSTHPLLFALSLQAKKTHTLELLASEPVLFWSLPRVAKQHFPQINQLHTHKMQISKRKQTKKWCN